MRLAGVVLLVAIAASGCKKGEDATDEVGAEGAAAPAIPDPIGEVEAERGRKACADFAEAMCARAEADPALAGDCELARARPGALEMNLRVARAEGNLEVDDLAAVVAETRKIAAGCLEDLAKLGGPGGARPGAETAPGSAAPSP